MSDTELARHDIAAINLACADGLPGAEEINVADCLRTLDAWAGIVKRWTDTAYLQYFLPNPGNYRNCEAFFRIGALATALERHCGIRYDAAKIGAKPEDPFEFDEQFIHGVIQGPGGTCATLPVVYAAVGRRLGYPIRLVATRRHLFCRWDDRRTGTQHNIEVSGEGFKIYADDHYRSWPTRLDPEDEQAFCYLQSMPPREELANFVSQRSYVLQDHGRHYDAISTLVVASALHPRTAEYPLRIRAMLRYWNAQLISRRPACSPAEFQVLFREEG